MGDSPVSVWLSTSSDSCRTRGILGNPGERVRRALDHAFFDAGIMIRPAGDTIELTPPLIMSENDIGEIMDKVGASIKAAA